MLPATPRPPDHRWRARHLWLAALTAGILILASWGHITPFWGDYGKWLYEVQQVGLGKTLYTEVYWPQLPLAAWLVGGWTRLAGAELLDIWALTSALAMSVALLFATYTARVLENPRTAAWLIPLGLVLTFATTGMSSAPIGMGMYMPAAPLGAAFLLASLLLAEALSRKVTPARAVALGAIVGLGLATKIDFWPPLGVLVIAIILLPVQGRLRLAGYIVLGGLMVTAPIAIALFDTIPVRDAFDLLLGFGQAREFAGRSSPTLERLVLEGLSALGTLGCLVLICPPGRSRRASFTLGLGLLAGAALLGLLWIAQGPPGAPATGMFGWPGRREAVVTLIGEVAQHLPSALLPAVALLIAARLPRTGEHTNRRRVLMLLAAVACAARLRRMGEHIDFQNVLVELPLYAALVVEHCGGLRAVHWGRRVALTLFLVCVATTSHWFLGHGMLTRRGWRGAVLTERGTVHMTARDAELLRALQHVADSIDPAHARPLFAFGYSGGLNYFLRRGNPTATTQGMAFSVHVNVDSNVALIRNARPPVLLVDNRLLDEVRFPQRGVHLFRWRAPTTVSPYRRTDRPAFDALARECGPAMDVRGFPGFSVHNCNP